MKQIMSIAWYFPRLVVPIRPYGEPTMTVHKLNYVHCTSHALWRIHDDSPYPNMLFILATSLPLHCSFIFLEE